MSEPLHVFIRVAFGVTLLVLHPAPAWPDAGQTVARLSIPFAATVRDPTDAENVDVTGHLSVNTTVIRFSRPLKIGVVSRPGPDVTAIGETSGANYVVRGKSHFTYFWSFAPARISTTIPLRLYPPSSSLPTPPLRLWLLQFGVDYDVNGQVTSTDAMMVPDPSSGSCSTVVEVCR